MLGLECCLVSHIGNKRSNHEDNFYLSDGIYLTLEEQSQMSQSSEKYIAYNEKYAGTSQRIFAVSDGMGGHKGGEVASYMVTKSLQTFEEQLKQMPIESNKDKSECIKLFQNHIMQTNDMILKKAKEEDLISMGATLSGLICLGKEVVIFNIGDSSTFLYDSGELTKLTKDNNEAQLLIDMKMADPTDYELLRKKRRLTKYFGLEKEYGLLTAQMTKPFELQGNKMFLICSDGLTDSLEQEEIKAILSQQNENIYLTAKMLINRALQEGENSRAGYDNTTLLLIRVINL